MYSARGNGFSFIYLTWNLQSEWASMAAYIQPAFHGPVISVSVNSDVDHKDPTKSIYIAVPDLMAT